MFNVSSTELQLYHHELRASYILGHFRIPSYSFMGRKSSPSSSCDTGRDVNLFYFLADIIAPDIGFTLQQISRSSQWALLQWLVLFS